MDIILIRKGIVQAILIPVINIQPLINNWKVMLLKIILFFNTLIIIYNNKIKKIVMIYSMIINHNIKIKQKIYPMIFYKNEIYIYNKVFLDWGDNILNNNKSIKEMICSEILITLKIHPSKFVSIIYIYICIMKININL
jgi:hypothetical protein